MSASWFRAKLAAWIVLTVAHASLAAPPCTGDCDDRGGVTVGELIVGVDGVLGQQTANPCGDGNGDSKVTVDEVVDAVNNAARGCPTDNPPTPTPTATPMMSGPIDAAFLGTWSGTARNESTGLVKAVRIKIELQGNQVVVSDLGGNLYKTAPASITMSAPTRTTLTYNVLGNPVIVFNLTLGANQLAGIYSATTVGIPPVIDAVGLVLTKEVPLLPDPRLAGTWSGTGNASPGGQIQVQLRLEIQGDGVLVTDLMGNVFTHIPSSVTMRPEGAATALSFVCDSGPCGNGNPIVTLNLSLLASGRLVGSYYAFAPGGQVSTSFNLGRP